MVRPARTSPAGGGQKRGGPRGLRQRQTNQPLEKQKMHTEVRETDQSLAPTEVQLALTSGLAPGAKLRENRLFALSPTGVDFKGELTLAQWMEGMLMLSWMTTAFTIWL